MSSLGFGKATRGETRERPELRLFEICANLRKTLNPKFGEGETRAIIRLIFHHLKGWNATDLIIHEGDIVSDFTQSRIEEITDRLLKDEPIQYITGEARFYGMDLKIQPGVLIPRPETEELVDLIVKENKSSDLTVLDACTGSGCIAISLARNLPFSKIYALDNAAKAIATAKLNASNLKTDIHIFHEDIFAYSPMDENFDIIVSNPPYIDNSEKKDMEANVLDYEPPEALFVPDSDPLIFYRKIAGIGTTALTPEGKIYFEINPRHTDELVTLMAEMGYKDVRLHRDIHGKERFLSAFR